MLQKCHGSSIQLLFVCLLFISSGMVWNMFSSSLTHHVPGFSPENAEFTKKIAEERRLAEAAIKKAEEQRREMEAAQKRLADRLALEEEQRAAEATKKKTWEEHLAAWQERLAADQERRAAQAQRKAAEEDFQKAKEAKAQRKASQEDFQQAKEAKEQARKAFLAVDEERKAAEEAAKKLEAAKAMVEQETSALENAKKKKLALASEAANEPATATETMKPECADWECTCMGMSIKYGVNHRHSWGRATKEQRVWWHAHKCTTRPVQDVPMPQVFFVRQAREGPFDTWIPTDTCFAPDLAAHETCLNAMQWLKDFECSELWQFRRWSQGNQDGVLRSLFDQKHLGTTNKGFIEFGFPELHINISQSNSHYLWAYLGFHPELLMDGTIKEENPEIKLFRHWITQENVVGLFDQHKVTMEPDYLSIDIDECDIWMLFAITAKYRPRVISIEYNSNYAIDNFDTLACREPWEYHGWRKDNLYGASLSAIYLAAQERGYTVVYATLMTDVWLVRNDLVCEHTRPPLEIFTKATSVPMHHQFNESQWGPRKNFVIDFKTWLSGYIVATNDEYGLRSKTK